jgi:hypothetical protein
LLSALTLDRYKEIVKDTYAIFFLGTPHNGADMTAMAHMAQRLVALVKLRHSASTNLTEELKPYSATTVRINGQFKDTAKGIGIFTFYEQKETRLPPPYFSSLVSVIHGRAIPPLISPRLLSRAQPS